MVITLNSVEQLSNKLFFRFVQSVSFPLDTDNEVFSGETAKVAGWGYTDENGPSSTVLMSTIVNVLTDEGKA